MVGFFNLKILIVIVSHLLEKELVEGLKHLWRNRIQICKGTSTLKVGNLGAKTFILDTKGKQ